MGLIYPEIIKNYRKNLEAAYTKVYPRVFV